MATNARRQSLRKKNARLPVSSNELHKTFISAGRRSLTRARSRSQAIDHLCRGVAAKKRVLFAKQVEKDFRFQIVLGANAELAVQMPLNELDRSRCQAGSHEKPEREKRQADLQPSGKVAGNCGQAVLWSCGLSGQGLRQQIQQIVFEVDEDRSQSAGEDQANQFGAIAPVPKSKPGR